MFNNQSQRAKTDESMRSLELSFFSFFILNKCTLKVSREYICQDFDTNGENKFLIVQLMSMAVKKIMVLHV
jgi:hypothetical protein